MRFFWTKTCRELYRRTTLTAAQAQEITDEEIEDTMWEETRPWEEQWETLKVNESKVEDQVIDDDDRQARFWRHRPDQTPTCAPPRRTGAQLSIVCL